MPMERDDDFIRSLLLEYEQGDDIYLLAVLVLNSSREDLKRHHHAELLCDAGYFERVNDGVYRMTTQGYDYLEVIKSENVWKKTKEGAAQLGGTTLAMMKDLAVAYVKQEAAEKLGITL